jgi:hypothetical protein
MKNKIIKQKKEKDSPEVLFIPTGILLGIGFGFLYDQLIPSLFIGLGTGFLIFAIIAVIRNKKI